MRILIIKLSGSFVLALMMLSCADLSVAKNAYKNGDFELAEKNYKELAKRGFPNTQKILGNIALKKDPNNTDEALSHYINSYNDGNDDAIINIVKLKETSDYDIEKLKEHSANRYAKATYQIALYYEDRDDQKALEYFNLAKKQGHQKGQFKISKIELKQAKKLYEQQYFDKASKIYLKYAEQGNIIAIHKLATIFHIQQKTEQSIEWYKLLIDEYYPEAWYKLSHLLKQKDPKQSLELLKNASNTGLTNAQLDYGKHLFENGKKYEGLKLVFIAAQKKDKDAIHTSLEMISQMDNLDDVDRAYFDAKKR